MPNLYPLLHFAGTIARFKPCSQEIALPPPLQTTHPSRDFAAKPLFAVPRISAVQSESGRRVRSLTRVRRLTPMLAGPCRSALSGTPSTSDFSSASGRDGSGVHARPALRGRGGSAVATRVLTCPAIHQD